MKKLYNRKLILLLNFLMFFASKNFAATETLASGAFIINMGVVPQTINKGLKPYGMVYDLLKNYQVPIKWVISTSKIKDGADFTYSGVQYKGGTFIIPAEYRTTAVNIAITNWVSSGVIGVTTNASITVEVFKTILFVPGWTLDKTNGSIAVSFFQNAGIPPSAYGGSSSTGWKLPSQLTTCDDIFVMPHADPTWATHQNLYFWNKNFKGNIWSGCHAISVMESLTNPGATIQMNFLSTTGLVSYLVHNDGSRPYNYRFPTDPVMQFMGTLDGATANGSEQIFMPKLAGAWRSGANVGVYDPTHQNVPSLSPGEAAVAIYGLAYNDSTRGYVMYEAGHDLNSGMGVTVAERVAAQRAFFNYSFFATQVKVQIPYIDMSTVPGVVRRGDTVNFNFNLPPGYNPANYSIVWTSSCGGSFIPNNTTKATKFVVPTNPSITSCVISVTLTDACSRQNFASKSIFVVTSILQNGWGNLRGVLLGNNVNLRWFKENEVNLNRFSVERSTDGVNFVSIGTTDASGDSTEKKYYDYTDFEVSARDYFYRVIAIDKQNREAKTNTVFIGAKNKGINFKITPNPVTKSSVIDFYSDKEQSVTITCIDMTGKRLFTSNYNINRGQTKISPPELRLLESGVFILRVANNNEVYYQKFVTNINK